eukprot:4293571-Prymnesium_polylepis.1
MLGRALLRRTALSAHGGAREPRAAAGNGNRNAMMAKPTRVNVTVGTQRSQAHPTRSIGSASECA